LLVDAGEQGVGAGMPGIVGHASEVDPHQAGSRPSGRLRQQASRQRVAAQRRVALRGQRRSEGCDRHGEFDEAQRHVGRRRQGGGQASILAARLAWRVGPAAERLEHGLIGQRVFVDKRSGRRANSFRFVGELSGPGGSQPACGQPGGLGAERGRLGQRQGGSRAAGRGRFASRQGVKERADRQPGEMVFP
jgi:hypothetical protein